MNIMNKEKFKYLVYKMLEHDEIFDKLYEIGLDGINCKYIETAGIFFDELMLKEFGEEGLDLISWWMYDEVDHLIYDGEDSEKVIADLNNIDDLYDYLTKGGRDGVAE